MVVDPKMPAAPAQIPPTLEIYLFQVNEAWKALNVVLMGMDTQLGDFSGYHGAVRAQVKETVRTYVDIIMENYKS